MKRNQHERILDWMDHNGSISPMEAFEFLNITKLATRVGELIRLVGLDPAMKKKVGQYSLGMRQRLGIAQALLDNPSLLILDEPMNGLDKTGVKEIRSLLLELKEQGRTILLASHFAQDIDELCDTVHEMDQGVIAGIK